MPNKERLCPRLIKEPFFLDFFFKQEGRFMSEQWFRKNNDAAQGFELGSHKVISKKVN